ncbi:alpha/beta hydrolase [Desulfovibrio piger]|uniref:alpha/beta hydrolase n=1 Tax=Desulfovibrio piger TaxID=901 RepID=UPI0026ECF151|nr:alpha/beta hydrolase [Desulfovibrio piger]
MSAVKTLMAGILAGTMLFAGDAAAADTAPSGRDTFKDGDAMELVQEWDKVFPRSDRVEHRKVTFRTRYGTVLAGDLYMPRDAGGKRAALAVSGPFGAVKEQASGLYAQTMAERGFLTLAFDPSYTGESSGEPRHVASPDINTEDFSAAVDFLTTLDAVDAERIGIIGICGFGGMGLNAAMDTRIKATVAVTMYDMSRVTANGYFDSMDADARYALRQQLNAQRTRDARSGSIAPSAAGLPEALTGDEPQFVKDYFAYYKTGRGFHPRSINSNGAWNATSALSFLNMPLLAYAGEIRSAVLLVHGEKAHSRYFSEDAFKKLNGDNKELLIVPGASHTDLYDRVDIIPFDRIEAFFRANL